MQEIQAQEKANVMKGSEDKSEFISGCWADITDIEDMLDKYHVHTGETLREIIPKSTLEDSPLWPV